MQAQLDGIARNRPIYEAIAQEHTEAGYDRIEGDEADSGATPTTTATKTNALTPTTTSTSTTSIAATSTSNSDTAGAGGQSSSSRNVSRPQSRGTRSMAVRHAGAKRGMSDTLLLLAEMEEHADERQQKWEERRRK